MINPNQVVAGQANAQPNAQPNVQPNVQPNAVSRIQVRVPPFWKLNPQLWFHQLEAQFANSHIVNDLTKFNTIVGVIESDILSAVSDIVLNPPAINLYDAIKTRLISQFSETEHKKLKSLLNDLTLGDMKPSDLLRKMRELSCGKVGDDLLKTLWLQRLPITIQTVLSTSNDLLTQLTVMADTMFDITEASSSVQAISSPLTKNLDDLVNVVYKLDDKINSLKKDWSESKKSHGQTSRNRSPATYKANPSSKNGFCYYHKHFGKDAIKCKTPCNFIVQNSENSQAKQVSRHLSQARE